MRKKAASSEAGQLTEQDFFDFIATHDDGKYDFWDGQIFMAEPSPAHDDLAERLFGLFNVKLKSRCNAHLDRGIYVPACTTFRRPDVIVVCGERKIVRRENSQLIANPIIVVEVTSPGTENFDHRRKLAEYKTIPSLNHYLIAEQDKPEVIVHSRAGKFWKRSEFGGLDAVIQLKDPDVAFKLSDAYQLA